MLNSLRPSPRSGVSSEAEVGGAEHDAVFHLLQQHPRDTRLPPAPLAGRAGRLGQVQTELFAHLGTSGHRNLLLCIGNRVCFGGVPEELKVRGLSGQSSTTPPA
jgi:hypothetical protein